MTPTPSHEITPTKQPKPEPPAASQLLTKARQMVPDGPPDPLPKTLLERLLHQGPDPAHLAPLQNDPNLSTADSEREAQEVKDYQAFLFQDVEAAFGPKQDPDAWCYLSDNLGGLLRAKDRLEVLKVALTKYPAHVASIYPLAHHTLRQSQPADAEEFLRHVVSLDFPDPIWCARCELHLGVLHGLKLNHAKALELIDNSLPLLLQAAPSTDDWQFIVTGKTGDEGLPQSSRAPFGEEVLIAHILTAKASAAAGNYSRAVAILLSILHDEELLAQILPDASDRSDLSGAIEADLEVICKILGGKLPEQPVAFDETLPADAHGKLLSDIYYGLYICCKGSHEAANALARHKLFWSALGQTSPFLGV